MHPAIKYITAALFCLLTDTALHGYPDAADRTTDNPGYSILPRAGLLFEAKGFWNNDAGYRMETHRILDLDLFRINNIFFSFYFNEYLLFNNKESIRPRSVTYEMDYANLRWESPYGILSFFFDHDCTNVTNDNQSSGKQVRWYAPGLRWESYGMKTGRKNKDPRNKITDNLSYRLSVERSIGTQDFDFKYKLTGALRFDILRYYFLTPYVEGDFTWLIDGRDRLNRYIETGIRMNSGEADFTPFIGINQKYDAYYNNGSDIDLFYTGLRMETLIMNDTEAGKTAARESMLSPEFHIRGSYGKYIADDNLNYYADFLIELNLLNSRIISPYFKTRLMHNSLKESAGMYPRYLYENIESGFSYKTDLIAAHIEPFYRYSRIDHGNFYGGYNRQFSEAGLRFISGGMKTGFGDNAINKAPDPDGINNIDWSVSTSWIFDEKYYNYNWICEAGIRWNILRINKAVPYISAGLDLFAGAAYDSVYNIESGIRTRAGIYWILFYRFEYRTETEPVNGLFGNYHLAGIRFEI